MSTTRLHLDLTAPRLDPAWQWFCEPGRWTVDTERRRLRIEPDAGTDFWQRTHYGYRTDNGHFLYAERSGDFVITGHFLHRPANQYDQIGLMVRLSPDCWLKTSVEFEPHRPSQLGAVVTNAGYSDWSTQDFPPDQREIWLRVRREANDYLVEAAPDGQRWSQIRMARLHEDDGQRAVRCGAYTCSPKDRGYIAEIAALWIAPGRIEVKG